MDEAPRPSPAGPAAVVRRTRPRPRVDPLRIEGALSPKWDIALGGLSQDERDLLQADLVPVRFAAREHLFHEGDRVDQILVLRAGRVRLFQTRADGQEFSYGIFFAGTILNLAAFVLGGPGVLSAEALTPVSAARMGRAGFERCLSAIPRFQRNVMTLLATLALDSIAKNTPMALDRADARLGRMLLDLAKPEPCDGGEVRVAHVRQEELGRLVGVSRTWVGQTLAEFEAAGLIAKTRGRVRILDPDGLRRLLGEG